MSKPSPTPDLTWMKQPVADWLRNHDPAVVPPYCTGAGISTLPDPGFDAWFAGAMRKLALIPCEELDTRLITFRGAAFGPGARIHPRSLPATGSRMNRCFPSEGPSIDLGLDDAGNVRCVMPVIHDGPHSICLG